MTQDKLGPELIKAVLQRICDQTLLELQLGVSSVEFLHVKGDVTEVLSVAACRCTGVRAVA